MKQLTIFSLISIWLVLLGCGDEETPVPTIAKDTTPPTIVATNVQGGPIPTNTSIVLVFSERVNLTSAQRGISVRSSIDAEPVKGVITLQKSGREVKFTPTERMTSGAYVLTVIGIEDTAGNVLLTPVSIFFGAVEVDTTQPAADITPPKVVSSTPADGQSVKATDSLVIRFNEEVDVASAQAGVVVSGIEGTVDVAGAVAIFKPQKPMAVGKHTLVIVGVKDLAGNVLESSIIIPFEVIAPPPEVTPPPPTGRPSGGILFRAFSGEKPIPNVAVEKPTEWNKRNVTPGKNVFQVADGRLKQTSNGCSESTKTLFPVNGSNWTDYTVVVDFWDRDNDAISIIFRYTDPNSYYNFTIGAGDFNNTWYLGDATAREKDCFDSGAPTIATGPNGLNIDESGNTAYTAMVRVTGSKIEVFFGEQVSRRDILAGKTPPKLGEVIDYTHKKGTVGIHMGSNPADFANIFVFGPGGPRAVDVKDRISTVWGALKSAQ